MASWNPTDRDVRWDAAKKTWVNPDGSQAQPVSTNAALDLINKPASIIPSLASNAYGSTQVDAPPNVADTPAGKQATDFAGRLIGAQGSLPTPTYGSTAPIPVGARPTAPGEDIYAQANRELATMPTGYGDLAAGVNALSAGLVQRGSVATSPYNVAGTAINQQNAQTQSAQKQIADYQKAAAAWDQIYGGQAQQSGYQANAMQIGSNSNGFQSGMVAPQASAPQLTGSAPRVTFNPLTGRYDVQAPQQIRAGTVAAQMIGDQQMRAPADIAQAGEMRDAQLRALGLYEGAANGTAPSAAEALLRKGIDENVGAQYGMAASLQGNTPGLALRAGLTGAQGAVAKSAADMAALRAEEQERGRAGFLQAATGIRAQDITIAQSNQTKDLTTAVTNLNARIDILKSNQQAALQAGMANQAADLQAQIHNA
ncbi:MAG TPA: hypothetical protein VMS92_24315, partial [Mycobacterium sp.]|nr:hypothetical protein [Mycobacterium sp.]